MIQRSIYFTYRYAERCQAVGVDHAGVEQLALGHAYRRAAVDVWVREAAGELLVVVAGRRVVGVLEAAVDFVDVEKDLLELFQLAVAHCFEELGE